MGVERFLVCQYLKEYHGLGGMAQSVQSLPSKCEALNSNSGTAKNKIKEYHVIDSFPTTFSF
jgi:hypothetical protein